ncbi:Reverse transcriptase-like protein [Candidatus Methanoperedenaceae archaeon GB37]|nr:Reverse transcriptase-like protein [Candidatus Methanoperedenaceae archaeon GB37]
MPEWTAFIEALKEAQKLNITHLTVKGDSQLVVNQINNIWRVRDGNIVKLHRQAKEAPKILPGSKRNSG